MSHTFNAVRKIRQSLVRPARFSIHIIAMLLAGLVGIAGNFMQASPELKDLEMGDVVEQIHSTIERREVIKDLENEMKELNFDAAF